MLYYRDLHNFSIGLDNYGKEPQTSIGHYLGFYDTNSDPFEEDFK